MAADVSRNADWRKYLIYLNLALATLAPSNANAQNTDTDTMQPKKPKITLASLKEKAIKVVDGTSVIRGENGKALVIDNVLSPGEKEQIKDNISQTGMDIRYDKNTDKFIVRQDGAYNDVYTLENTDYGKMMQQWQHRHDSIYANPLRVVKKYMPIKNYILKGGNAAYDYEAHKITLSFPTQEGKAEAIRLVMDERGVSFAEADSIVNAIIKLGNDAEYAKYRKIHEGSHAIDHEKGIFRPDMSSEKTVKLFDLTEIKATMSMAGTALQHYKKTGDLSHFAYVNVEVDTLALQRDLRDGNGKDNPEMYVAKYIFDNWLEKNNQPDTNYSNEIKENSDYLINRVITQTVGDSPAMYQEYLRRVDLMFSDVEGLGDVRAAVNPDFELNSQLKRWIAAEEKNSIADNISHGSIQEDMDRLRGLLLVIRDLDKGENQRSPKTQAAINKAIENLKTPQKSSTYDMTQLMNLNVRTK